MSTVNSSGDGAHGTFRCRCDEDLPITKADLRTLDQRVTPSGQRDDSRTGTVPVRPWREVLSELLTERYLDEDVRELNWPKSSDSDADQAHARDTLDIAMCQVSAAIGFAFETVDNADWIEADFYLDLKESENYRAFEDQQSRTYELAARILIETQIICYQMREERNYTRLRATLDQCTNRFEVFQSKHFISLRSLYHVAKAGGSRTERRKEQDQLSENKLLEREVWESLAESVSCLSKNLHASMPSNDGEPEPGICLLYPLLTVVSAFGHMRRGDLLQSETTLHEFLHEKLDELHKSVQIASEGAYSNTGSGISPSMSASRSGENFKAIFEHQLHYYRYFVCHIEAMRLAMTGTADASVDNIDIGGEREALREIRRSARYKYQLAATAIESALQSIDTRYKARFEYYDLTSENLEHEEGLRLALLDQRIQFRETWQNDATEFVETEAKKESDKLDKRHSGLQDEMRQELSGVSMRMVEIMGVFLAIIAFVATIIVSAASSTVDAGPDAPSFISSITNNRYGLIITSGLSLLLFMIFLRVVVRADLNSWLDRRRSRRDRRRSQPNGS